MLIGPDVRRLEHISQSGRLVRYVKILRIKDDAEHVREPLTHPSASSDEARLIEREIDEQAVRSMRRACRTWPRGNTAILDVDRIAVGKIQTILQERRFSLEALLVQEDYDGFGDNEFAIALAQEIVSDADLAITSLRVQGVPTYSFNTSSTLVTFCLDQERQGESAGFSILREADVEMGVGPASNHLLDRLVFHAPMLEDLRFVGLAKRRGKEDWYDELERRGQLSMKLKRVRLESFCPETPLQL
jgi:hypothetical protein